MVIEKPKNVYLPYASMITSKLDENGPPLKYFNI
jgi:predicted small metal-binding protein